MNAPKSEASDLTGRSRIGIELGSNAGRKFRAVDPATGDELDPEFVVASDAEIASAVARAAAAAPILAAMSGERRGQFLRAVASEIEASMDALVSRMPLETGLPEGRVRMEAGRTCGQLRMFADLVEEGSWVDARIDRGDPAREPVPKPDVRSMNRAVGPVAVFCASNFPLAFSVAGGDTASAWAAGNPVVVVAHHAHPGTAEIVASAIVRASESSGMPNGTFSLLQGTGEEVGIPLVSASEIRAVGFTGSRRAGIALQRAAQLRPDPIPVFAEMSSINPVFVFPGALADHGESIAAGLAASIALGVGQFCTNPGVVAVPRGDLTESFVSALTAAISATDSGTMLHAGIRENYENGISKRSSADGIATSLRVQAESGPGGCSAGPAIFRVDVGRFVSDRSLHEEVFGPSTLLVEWDDDEDLAAIVQSLEGQLTITIHATEAELASHSAWLSAAEAKSGRILFGGFPTGVEVCSAMVHGGPFPATTDGRSTSVGTRAIYRFARPVCFQGFPNESLPAELREENPARIRRMEDGVWID